MANGLFGGGNGTPENPYLVEDILDLRKVENNVYAHYKQTADIDLTGLRWRPLGTDLELRDVDAFTGSYDGGNFKIINLYSVFPEFDWVGLFGVTIGGTYKNMKLINPTIVSLSEAGAIAGSARHYILDNCHVIGGTITAIEFVAGGLVGADYAVLEDGLSKITKCSTTCDVISIESDAGGLAAYSGENSVIENCFTTGNVSGAYYAGGLFGYTADGTLVENCYATGFIDSYEPDVCGGLIGENNGTVISSYYDSDTSGASDIGKGEPRTTEEMQSKETFINWDFNNIWSITEGISYPTFKGKTIQGTPMKYPFNIRKMIAN